MKISETAFYLLGANIHSSRIEIRNLVEEKSFIDDEQDCRNAERNLLQSNKRIEQEIAWLPGVAPEIATRLVKNAENGLFSRKYTYKEVENELPALAASNLLSETVYHILNSKPETIDITLFDGIVRIASELYDQIELDEELNRINIDRSVAGFPQFTDKQLLEAYIDKQRNELSAEINQALRIFNDEEEKEWLSSIIEKLTKGGSKQLPSLLDELVWGYELKKTDIHTQQEEEICRLISEIEQAVQNSLDKETQQNLSDLKSLLEKWSASIYPILLAYKSKGVTHKAAEKIISEVRILYIKSVEDYNNEEIFPALVESLTFVIGCVPKYADLLKNDLSFLHGRFRESILLKKIKAICSQYEELPKSKADVLSSFQQLKQQLSSELLSKLGENSGDWLCLLYIKYGAALANIHKDFKNSLMIFKESLNLPTSDRIKKLIEDNIRRVERNKEFLQKKIKENEENRRQYIINLEKLKIENKKKNIIAAILCAVLACCCALGLWYVNSPEYEWNYISTKPLETQINYLKNRPSLKNKKQLTRLIVQQMAALPTEQTYDYIGKVIIDEDTAFEELTATPTIQGLSLFLKLFPDTSSSRKQTIRELQTSIAERDWENLSTPYTLDLIQDFLSTYEGVVDPSEIQRRVCSSIIQSTDASYIATFMDYIEEQTLKDQLVSRIDKIERENWTRVTLSLTSISELVSYREKLYAENVKVLVDQRIAELEEIEWREKYSNSSSESSLLEFKKTLRSKKVIALVESRLHELYASFTYAQQINTIEAYNRFISLSDNQEEQEMARRRIIDLEVAEIARGQHSVLPPQHSNAYQYNRTGIAEIEIKNDTAYPLTAMYSGRESEKVIIPAHERRTIQIRSGEYAIAVTTTQPNVTPFYGKESIDSGKYQVTYYISSAPSYLPRSNYYWR